ncbi:MAG: hypothetical protein U0169_27530 [Polyangiaceae bacterium]
MRDPKAAPTVETVARPARVSARPTVPPIAAVGGSPAVGSFEKPERVEKANSAAETARLHKQIAIALSNIADLEEELERERKERSIEADTTADMLVRLASGQAENDALKKRIAELEGTSNHSDKKIAAAEAETERVRSDVRALEERFIEVEKAKDELDALRTNMDVALADAKADLEASEKRFAASEEKRQALELSNLALEEELEGLRKRIDASSADVGTAEETAAALSEQLTDTEALVAEMKEAQATLEADLERARESAEKALAELELRDERIRKLEDTAAAKDAEIESLTKANEDLERSHKEALAAKIEAHEAERANALAEAKAHASKLEAERDEAVASAKREADEAVASAKREAEDRVASERARAESAIATAKDDASKEWQSRLADVESRHRAGNETRAKIVSELRALLDRLATGAGSSGAGANSLRPSMPPPARSSQRPGAQPSGRPSAPPIDVSNEAEFIEDDETTRETRPDEDPSEITKRRSYVPRSAD